MNAPIADTLRAMAERRDWSWLEIPLIFGVLVGGAFLRYWISTALPFDASEFSALSEASVRTHAVRIPFIMFNGMSLFMLYIIARRSAGVLAAFALLLLLQTSVPFQEYALRIRWSDALIFIAMTALAYLRFSWPPWRPPQITQRLFVGVVVLLAHAQNLSRLASVVHHAQPLPADIEHAVAIYDAEGVALFIVAEAKSIETTRRVLGIGR